MSLLTKKGTLTVPAGTGSQSYTGIGFQPKAIIFFGTRQTAAGYAAGMASMVGFAGGSTQGVAVTTSADNVSPTQPSRGTDTALCIMSLVPSSAATDIAASFTSFDADGFTLNWSAVSGGQFIVHYLALGGSDITGAFCGSGQAKTTTGTQSYTGVGFQPDFLLTVHQSTSAAATTQQTGGRLGIGAAATGGSGALYIGETDGVATSDVVSYQAAGNVFAQGNPSSSPSILASLSSFDADGFTLNFGTVSGSSIYFLYLALQGGQYNVVADTQKTSTGTKAKTGVGFNPKGLFFMGTNRVSSASADSTVSKLSLGATDGTAQGATWSSGTDAVNPTDENSATVTTVALRHATNASTTDAEATISSLDSDGYTLNWTTADGTAREFLAIAFGPTASAVTGSASLQVTATVDSDGVYLQVLHPSADSADGNWTDDGGGTALAAAIDEATPSDTDYIESELAPSVSGCRVKLATSSDPGSSVNHQIRWRVGKDTTGGDTINVTVKLVQGGADVLGAGTVIASFARNDVDALTTYTETLTGTQADAITDYGDLYLEFYADTA